jgi:hypothetical protein
VVRSERVCLIKRKEARAVNEEEQILLTIWAQHQLWKTRTEGHILLTSEKLIFQPGKLNHSKINPFKETREGKSWNMEDIIGIKRGFPLLPWRYFEIKLKDSKSESFWGLNWDVSRLTNQLKLLSKEIS